MYYYDIIYRGGGKMKRYEFKSLQCIYGLYTYTCIDVLSGIEMTVEPEQWRKLKKIKIADVYEKEVNDDNKEEIH
jgi:hypothetical protein